MRFQYGSIINGYLDNKRCIYKDTGCGNWCPHFGEPKEVILTHRHQRHIAEDFTYTHEKTGKYQLRICQNTLLDLGEIVL